MHKCSLIVSVYNQARQLDLLLDCASKQTESQFEIIIADDGSSDNTPDVIQKWQHRFDLQHIWHADQGFYKTVILNRAVKKTNSEYLVVVDGDMLLHHRFIEMHLKYAHPMRVMCGWRGCKINRDTAERLINRTESFSTQTSSVLLRGLKGEIQNPFRTTVIENSLLRSIICKERNHLGGCNFGLHKTNFELCNGMDESILQYGYEDFELGHRLQNNGIQIMGIRNCANTYHLEHAQSKAPDIRSIKTRIKNSLHKQCRFGLNKLNSGSSNDTFMSDK